MQKTPPLSGIRPDVAIVLNAVLAAVEDEQPKILCVRRPDGILGLPYGPFDPVAHRTLEIGLRDWVTRQTHVSLGFIEQLYTFGDKGRETPIAALIGGDANARMVSVGYLALASEPAKIAESEAQWRNWYDFFPWEDWRKGEPEILTQIVMPGLQTWTEHAASESERADRERRVSLAFGLAGIGWEEERALDRYELMYESALVEEAWRDRALAPSPALQSLHDSAHRTGVSMASDHRRILATAIGRLRGKLKYRPIIFELMPPLFTLLSLQKAVEALTGFDLHKQNFRRHVELGGLVKKTRKTSRPASGRPAALFQASGAARIDGAACGLAIPRLRRSPTTVSADSPHF